jgi:hypothetical protein
MGPVELRKCAPASSWLPGPRLRRSSSGAVSAVLLSQEVDSHREAVSDSARRARTGHVPGSVSQLQGEQHSRRRSTRRSQRTTSDRQLPTLIDCSIADRAAILPVVATLLQQA